MRGARWAGKAEQDPHPGGERTSAGICGPLCVPGGGAPALGPRLSVGLGGERLEPGQTSGISEGWRCGEPGAGPPTRFGLCPLHLVAGAQGDRVLEDRMPGCLSGGGGGGGEGPIGFGAETAFTEGHRCVCALHHFEGMPPSSPLFPGGARPSAPVRHSLSPSLVLGPGPPPARSPPSPPSRPPAPTPGRPGVWVSPRRALASRMVAVRRQHVVKAHGVDRMKQRKLKVAW